tara:strand:+ start:19 stop:1059 length:1041 start_codon:yes stop_codon:yes gene_type:complete
MAYTTIPKSSLHFTPKLYTGTDNSNAITGLNFQPDFTWIKMRSSTASHALQDAVRGNDKTFRTNNTNAQYTNSFFSSFNSDGFTVATSETDVNADGSTYVAWNWKANGAGSANTTGSINSTVSANTTSGFSIVSYTGNGTSGATVGHGLGVVPQVIIAKRLNATDQMIMYHHSISATPQNYYIRISDNGAAAAFTGMWNDTAPTSSLFSIGNSATTNASSEAMIAYCFAEKQGFSKFGKYVGNGNADGAFTYTGFKIGWLMIKKNSAGEDWRIYDFKRLGYNPNNNQILANTNAAEYSATQIDLLSNGFKLRATDGGINEVGSEYYYMAFAEEPLVSSNGVAATAR